jgi:chemotaxis protein MotB
MYRSILSAALLLLPACVSQGRYDDLKQQYDRAQAQLGERQQRIGNLGASVQLAESEVAKLKEENARARAQLISLGRERDELEAEQRKITLEMTGLLEDRGRLKRSSEELQAALIELASRKAEAERRIIEFKGLLARFKNLIDAGTLKVTISDGRMVLQLPTDVLFDSGSAKLSKVGKDAITQVTAVLKEVPNRRYQIEGHTDNVPIHNSQYRSNWDLAAARGLGVVRAMSDAGMEARLLSAASYGEFHPVTTNDNEDGRRVNRRIEIILVPDLSMLPGYEALQLMVQAP